ncbi:MAG: outer membrane beta-barrel protein [Bacteroidales bacterium]|nr:outer membrane beta-barrel protein [Bacteroidales bacterium]
MQSVYKVFFLILLSVSLSYSVFAGNAEANGDVKVTLRDSATEEPVSFATVYIIKAGAKDPAKYALTNDKGVAVLEKVRPGTYTLKAEMMGYKSFEKEIKVDGPMDLGIIKMDLDKTVLDAATVSATGNPIVIKKDTVEYNASSFKTTDNDMLEDLLKKLPGLEVSEDGSITANGQTITKITIDGKTFFLDDPQLASKNIPAKIIEKVKVVEKKSEQAEFTGFSDGQEETVIDLSVQKGMMKGLFGNVMAGGGHDWTANETSSLGKDDGDYRYQGGAFIGRFNDHSQISLILNANNTNNRGFNDLAGGMMRGMMGGGGGMGRGGGGWGGSNGITSSRMGGINGAWDLFDNRMNIGGNYLYNATNNDVTEDSRKVTYLDDGSNLVYDNHGFSSRDTYGNRFGIRMDHKFSDKTSLLFQPSFNFGNGSYREFDEFQTMRNASGSSEQTNVGFNDNVGENKNWNTSGFLLFRQRLGKKGRTFSFMGRYNFSNNDMHGFNQSLTTDYFDGVPRDSIINQRFDQNQKGRSLSGRLTYTEPLSSDFFLEASYEYSWNKSTSYKNTYNSGDNSVFSVDEHKYSAAGETFDKTYSNRIENRYVNQSMGLNLMYQKDKVTAQIGFGANPTDTKNTTMRLGKEASYENNVVNWAPRAMLFLDPNDNTNLRVFYFGRSSQPSTSQLMPVPDNTNPLNVSFGNPYLEPYFNHNIRTEFRRSNKKTFSSLNVDMGAGLVQNPIVSAVWYGLNGAQYSIPVNGPSSWNGSIRMFYNTPIAKSNFSVSNMTNANYSKSSSYIGSTSFDTDRYYVNGDFDYELFHNDFPDLDDSPAFSRNDIQSLNLNDRLRLTYRTDNLELQAGGRMGFRKSWYTVSNASTNATWNNQVSGSVNWTAPAGFGLVSDFSYNWYRGYSTQQDPEYILNVAVTKLLFKNSMTVQLKAWDLLNQSKNLHVTDASNYHQEVLNNTLGRYVILSLTWRFGNYGNMRGMRGGRGRGGPGGPPPGGPPR